MERRGLFQPGDPRINRGGRPKSKPITDEILRELRRRPEEGGPTNLQRGVRNLVGIFVRGQGSEAVAAYKAIAAYVEGLPVQHLDIDLRTEAERIAAEYGVDVGRLINLADELKRRRAG